MNATVRPGFFQPVASFFCDVILVFLATTILTLAWAIQSSGVWPDTPAHLAALFDTSLALPDLLPQIAIGYVLASATALLGHRSIGLRLFGLEVTRVQR